MAGIHNISLCICFYVSANLSIPNMLAVIGIIIFVTLFTPSVSGGGILTATLLLSSIQADISVWLPAYIFIDLITDYIVTGANVYCLTLEIFNIDVILKKKPNNLITDNNKN